jgi:thymidylate synthase (FAD)
MEVPPVKVEAVWITPNAEQMIVDLARVSNPSNQGKPGEKLLHFLVENRHFSPFEMASMCVSIETSRAIAHQILRHRSFSFQEFSQRYSEATEFEPIELRRQAEKNRQSSTETIKDTRLQAKVNAALEMASSVYQDLLTAGVARECARMILPETTRTHLYMTGTIRSWIHYIDLRTDPHTQQEHRQVAEEVTEIFWGRLPTVARAMGWEW